MGIRPLAACVGQQGLDLAHLRRQLTLGPLGPLVRLLGVASQPAQLFGKGLKLAHIAVSGAAHGLAVLA